MRTSLAKLNLIENFLSGQIPPDEKILIEAQRVLDKDFALDVSAQLASYKVIRACSRQSLKIELEALHERLQRESRLKSFWSSIYNIFQKS